MDGSSEIPSHHEMKPGLKPVLLDIYRRIEPETRASERWCEKRISQPSTVPLMLELFSSKERHSISRAAFPRRPLRSAEDSEWASTVAPIGKSSAPELELESFAKGKWSDHLPQPAGFSLSWLTVEEEQHFFLSS